MWLIILILLLISEIINSCSNYTNRIMKANFLTLLLISCLVSVLANLISFSTMYYLGQSRNVIILQCILIVCSVCSVVIINRFVIKEPVHPASYLTLGLIVLILLIHHLATRVFYSKSSKNTA